MSGRSSIASIFVIPLLTLHDPLNAISPVLVRQVICLLRLSKIMYVLKKNSSESDRNKEMEIRILEQCQ